MAKAGGEKLKILLIRDYLLRYSDEAHPVTVKDIQQELEKSGITAERKSIYRDLKTLGCCADPTEPDDVDPVSYGMDIVNDHGRYYVRERDFTLQEVKLLVDMVQSSNFITESKTRKLIAKLESLTSIHEARTLNRTVFVRNRVKVMNESVYINVDKISEAINGDRILHFQYYSYDLRKEKQLRHNGEIYEVSPFALIWVDQNYYFLGYTGENDRIRAYRVDRMTRVTTVRGPRKGKKQFEQIDIATFTRKVFRMYLGEVKTVSIRFHTSLTDAVIDRFGTDVILVPDGEEHFIVQVEVAVSPQFYGWVAGFGTLAEILAPDAVRGGMAQHLKGALAQYEQQERG